MSLHSNGLRQGGWLLRGIKPYAMQAQLRGYLKPGVSLRESARRSSELAERQRVGAMRRAQGMSRGELAASVGMTRSALRRAENDWCTLVSRDAIALAVVLGRSLDELVGSGNRPSAGAL